ncbi:MULTISPECIES: hypothetical protein [unclassified Massilia]|uniref:hypothetical protein n=1 Tax=unclassified Massilia TaxID=2609279 RepID=UPI00177F988E|nr:MULTISPECIES: hypothetical protein [unclassified Massilia]MBD8532498.1 hypothetical protein [Massilia sp. CFBP 13647]MBD8675868.1 hypothetical protein [Massilia sp. CFBP 13721]
MKKKTLIIAALALVIAYWGARALVTMYLVGRAEAAGVEFTLDNVGSESLHGVSVDVTGRSYQLGDMPPGSSRTVKLHATGDSHIELRFLNGRRLIIDCYFQPTYKGTIKAKVTSQAVMAVEDKVKLSPY